MRLRSANAFWLLKNGMLNTYPSLREDIECDVLIVGGGITGALIAFQLSSEGYKTTLIDKEDVAFGSTAASTAMLQYELDRPLYRLIKEVGVDEAVDLYQGGVDAILSIEKLINMLGSDCGFERKESMYVARTAADVRWLKLEFEARKQNGLDVEWISEPQLWSDYFTIGKAAIKSAVGASVDAYKLTHELLHYAAAHNGLDIYDHTAQISVRYENEMLVTRTSTGNTIVSKRIVYATGYETQLFLKKKIVELVSTYVCISEPLEQVPPWISRSIYWTTDKPYLYIRSTPDNRILVGGGDEPFKDARRRDELIDRKEKSLLRKFRALLPDVPFYPDFTWAGTFGITKDTLPYIGEHKDFPKCLFVLGYGGNGITFSVLAMKVVSDAIAGRQNKYLDYLRFNR